MWFWIYNILIDLGAVDEASFKRDFESNLPSVRIYSPKDLDEQMVKIQVVLSDERKDWEERTKSVSLLCVSFSSEANYLLLHMFLSRLKAREWGIL